MVILPGHYLKRSDIYGPREFRRTLAQGFLRRGIGKKVEGEIKLDGEPYVRAASPSTVSRSVRSAVIIPEDGYLGRQQRATLISLRETIRDRLRYCKIHISRNEDSVETSRLRDVVNFVPHCGPCVCGISDGILSSVLAAPLLPNRERIFRAFTYLARRRYARFDRNHHRSYARARAHCSFGPKMPKTSDSAS